jgi:hypothetical protein
MGAKQGLKYFSSYSLFSLTPLVPSKTVLSECHYWHIALFLLSSTAVSPKLEKLASILLNIDGIYSLVVCF